MGRIYASPLRDTVRRIIERDGPVGAAAISDELRLPHGALARQIRRLRELAQIHIAEWQRPQGAGSWAPLYLAGAGKDAPEPRYGTHKEYSRRYRAKRWPEIRSRAQARNGRPVVAATWLSGLL